MSNVIPIRRFEKRIKFFGAPTTVACDGNCAKAFGINKRPREQLSSDDDDYAWLADHEVGIAPVDPGTYEGDHPKPVNASSGADLNKWCVRECERCVMADGNESPKLRDFSRRIFNMKAREDAGG